MRKKKKKKPLHATVRKPMAPGRRVMRSKRTYTRKPKHRTAD